MKSTRWWIRGIKWRVFKKHNGPRMCLDGVSVDLGQWQEDLEEVRALRPGDKIWNLYTKQYDEVAKVKFIWDHFGAFKDERISTGRRLRGIPGAFIAEYVIVTNTGYYLYDPPSMLEWYRNAPSE